VIPWLDDIGLDAEDSLALRDGRWLGRGELDPRARRRPLDVAVVRFPRISNFTDLDALALEPDVSLRLVESAPALGRPDLLILPGTKSTLADLDWLRRRGLDAPINDLATDPAGTTSVLGICGGYQMLGRTIADPDGVESRAGSAVGLGLLPTDTTFDAAKVTCLKAGTALGQPVRGYQIHHGRTRPANAWIHLDGPGGDPGGQDGHDHQLEGSQAGGGRIFGTSLHGLLESDSFRDALLASVARRAGQEWTGRQVSFAEARDQRFDRLADAVEANLDMGAIDALIAGAAATRPAAPLAPPRGVRA
jgi:adenosylcobyric acid synthase